MKMLVKDTGDKERDEMASYDEEFTYGDVAKDEETACPCCGHPWTGCDCPELSEAECKQCSGPNPDEMMEYCPACREAAAGGFLR